MATIKVKLENFRVPNYVIHAREPDPDRNNVATNTPKSRLNELEAETLSELCDNFRAEVFRKAGKMDPRESTQ